MTLPTDLKLTPGGEAAASIDREYPSQIVFHRAHQIAQGIEPRLKLNPPALQLWERFIPQAIQDFLDAALLGVTWRLERLEKDSHPMVETVPRHVYDRLQKRVEILEAQIRLLEAAFNGTVQLDGK